MSVIDELCTDTYLLREILQVYMALLKEKKQLHELNCPECEERQKPCKKYYWLFLDIQEVGWKIQQLNRELQDTDVR